MGSMSPPFLPLAARYSVEADMPEVPVGAPITGRAYLIEGSAPLSVTTRAARYPSLVGLVLLLD
jgi:hypothetical protein